MINIRRLQTIDGQALRTNRQSSGPIPITRGALPSVARPARLVLVGFVSLVGCSQYIDPDVPEPIIPAVEPEHAGEYLLYRPSRYDRRDNWPLIVVCHASFPDSANKRIRDWTQLAEEKGVIVAAPKLDASAIQWFRNADKQISKQLGDEQRILAVVRHVRAGHSVSPDRVFIHGWSSGAYPALYTGLKNPNVFRAVAVSRPKFDQRSFEDVAPLIDPYQRVYVHHNIADSISGKHARRCVDWLRDHHVDLTEDGDGDVGAKDTQHPIRFFEEVIGRAPWMRIHAFPTTGDNPLAVQFKLRYANHPTTVRWDFGDGETTTGQDPRHTYATPGRFTIVVLATDSNQTQHRRAVILTVPELTISTLSSTEDEEPQTGHQSNSSG